MPDTTDPTGAKDELRALTRLVTILEALDPVARARVVAWLTDRYLPDTEEPK